MSSRVGERGQITIEKGIREELAIYAGDETVQRVEDGRIVIEVIPGRHRRSLAGTPSAEARRAAALIDDDDAEIGIPVVALAECAHVLRTQYEVERRAII